MRYFKFLFITFAMLVSVGCASLNCKPNQGTALPGTETAIVGIYIDKNGYPQATVDTINVKPGQKIVFTGPNRFDILFKDQKSIIGKLEASSTDGVLIIEVPRNIFEQQQNAQRTTNTVTAKELLYRYGIRANGKVTDPSIIIHRE